MTSTRSASSRASSTSWVTSSTAQTVLARVYAAWLRVRHLDAYGYARKVLVNHVIDGWRRPIRELPTDEPPERRSPDAPERAVIVLRHYFDLPEAEVATELGVSVGTVKSTNSRALAKLRVVAQEDLSTTSGGAA